MFVLDPQSSPLYPDQPYQKKAAVQIPRRALPLEPVKTVYCADPDNMFTPKPYRIMQRIRQVSTSYYNNAAVDQDGVVWSWGPDILLREEFDYPPESVPQKVIYAPKRWMENVRSVSAGTWCILCVTNDSQLWGWGKNDYGQLGLGDRLDRAEPTFIMDGVKAVRASGAYTLVLKEDNSLWGFGYNGSRLGTGSHPFYWTQVLQGDQEFYVRPTHLMDHVLSFTGGDENVAVVREDHTLWMWGENHALTKAAGVEDFTCGPTLLCEGVKKVFLSKTYNMTCCMFIADNDDFYSAGGFGYGTFVGLKKGVSWIEPTKVIRSAADASIGWGFTLVRLTDGQLFSSGENSIGQCGIGRSTGSFRKPRRIFTHVIDAAAGYDHGMALQENGDLWIWGGDYGIEVPPHLAK